MSSKLALVGLLLLLGTASAEDQAPIQGAEDAYAAGEYEKAITLARRLTVDEHLAPRAWSVIVPAHCWLKQLEPARAGFDKVLNSRKASVASVCRRFGLKL